MFGKKQKDLMDSHIATIISEGCHIEGNIKTETSIKIDGTVNGNVDAKQGVILGDTAKVLGHLKAQEAIIFGQVQGNIVVQKLEIKSTGKIKGDIQTQSIEVEFGAIYNGKVSMSSQEQSKVATQNVLEEVN